MRRFRIRFWIPTLLLALALPLAVARSAMGAHEPTPDGLADLPAERLPGFTAQDASPAATPAFAILEIDLLDAAGEEVGIATVTELEGGGVGFLVEVEGLQPGDHGIHVHETGICDPDDDPPFASAGGHFNPTDAPHGGPPDLEDAATPAADEEAHAGDLGNLTVEGEGFSQLSMSTDRVTLAEGEPTSLVDADGSALVIHADPDDLSSQPAGASGARIVCGVIAAPAEEGTPAASTPRAHRGRSGRSSAGA
jgi:Cu-Zn family superoxide dismutase